MLTAKPPYSTLTVGHLLCALANTLCLLSDPRSPAIMAWHGCKYPAIGIPDRKQTDSIKLGLGKIINLHLQILKLSHLQITPYLSEFFITSELSPLSSIIRLRILEADVKTPSCTSRNDCAF